MLPDPLHPAVVHFPVALAALTPLFAALIAIAIRAKRTPRRTWLLVVLMQALLVGSTWLAHETGEDEEERVEKVLALGEYLRGRADELAATLTAEAGAP